MDVPFGPWEPDRGETAPGITFDASNVIPHAEGWGPMPALVVSAGATALPAQPRGLAPLTTSDGTWNLYAGTSTNLYKMQNDYSWTSVDSGRTLTAGDDWSFARFGTKLLYTNTTDGLLAYDVEAGGASASISAAKKPRQIFVVANQVVGLDCLDSSSNRNNRLLRTSAFSDHTNWSTNGADYQPIEDGGALIGGGALSETAGVVLQERALRLMDYGSPSGSAYFALRLIATQTGSIGSRSHAFVDGRAFFWSTDGPYMYTLGGALVPIGSERMSRWWLNTVDQSNLTLVQSAVDPLHKIVWWRFKRAVDSSTTVASVMIGYAWQVGDTGRWVPPVIVDTSYLTFAATPGYTVDTADALGLLDAIDIPLDSRFWQGGQPLFAALDGSYKFGTFSGGAMEASIQSGTANSPVTGLIGWATPIDDAASGTLTLLVKDALSDAFTTKTSSTKVSAGRTPQRGRGNNIAFIRDIPAYENWSYAKGVDHVIAASGGPK
jgi:hypothetical protein